MQKDDMEQIKQDILSADMVVFVTPLYYYGMSAQLKILIDRFCAFNGSIQRKHMKSALLAVAWNNDDWTMTALVEHYKTLGKVFEFQRYGNGAWIWLWNTRNDKKFKISYNGL